ncbi:MAG: DUF3106 domain-containing protein [Burkholderiales bacterium]|nr:DUF3106 domain-containing protein [Burkholderiales bacterium]
MAIVDPNAQTRSHPSLPRLLVGAVLLGVVVVLSLFVFSRTQTDNHPTPQATAPLAKPSAPQSGAVLSGPQWQDLSSSHKKILQPLAATWNSMRPTHKAKWIALANNFPNRTPEDQAKLQSRMAEWAALSPIERERARLNFAGTKKLSPTERAAEWAAYQELSDDERKRLAAKGGQKPAGAAVAILPVPNDKLTAVPVTRRTGQLPDAAAAAKPQLDPNTLLPKVVIPAPATTAPASTDGAPAATVPAITSDTLSPN